MELTAQQVFDTASTHLLKQKCQSFMRNSTLCAYRGHGGTMCAVGALINNDEYTPDMEDRNVADLIAHATLPARLVPHEALLTDLQHVHDSYTPDEWPDLLMNVAKKFNVKFTK